MIVRTPAAGSGDVAAPAKPSAGGAAEPEMDVGTVDWAGIFLLVTSVVCLCLAVVWGGSTYEWGSGIIIALFVVAAVLGAALVYVEGWVAKDPVVPMRLFKSANFAVCIVVGFFAGFAMFGSYVYLPIYFQVAKGSSASESGIHMIPMMLAMPIGAMVSGVGLTVFKKLDYKICACWGRLPPPRFFFTAGVSSNHLFHPRPPQTPLLALCSPRWPLGSTHA